MNFEPVIGLEVHVQLKTESKIFCSCSTRFGEEPNSNTCPVCLGLPGTLPVLNKKALEYAILTALALNCDVAERLKFDRKNYFYPDLPKAYQISQYDMPIAYNGYVEVDIDGAQKKIGITRAHLEEDAGKLLHEGISDGSYVDYNRTGTPLLEIVSEPDIKSPQEAYAYLTDLKTILQYIEISDCNMEEGSLRCDANISIRPEGTQTLGTKVEIKNLNSFKAVQRALEYEIQRQMDVRQEGGQIVQETRLWNDTKGVTFSMRSKEEAHDYRYFPEPDLVPFTVSRENVDAVKNALPELPREKKNRFIKHFELSEYDAGVLVQDRQLAQYFEETINAGGAAKQTANWLQGDVLRYLNEKSLTIDRISMKPQQLAGLMALIEKGTISGKIAKEVILLMMETGKSADDIVKEKGLSQVSDERELLSVIEKVVTSNQKSIEDYAAGKKQALGFLMGQIMKETKGKANPQVVNTLLKERLDKK